MNTVTAIRKRILHLCNERNLTINDLAKISGVSLSTLKNILSEKSKRHRITTIKKICDGLDITIGEFFKSE